MIRHACLALAVQVAWAWPFADRVNNRCRHYNLFRRTVESAYTGCSATPTTSPAQALSSSRLNKDDKDCSHLSHYKYISTHIKIAAMAPVRYQPIPTSNPLTSRRRQCSPRPLPQHSDTRPFPRPKHLLPARPSSPSTAPSAQKATRA